MAETHLVEVTDLEAENKRLKRELAKRDSEIERLKEWIPLPQEMHGYDSNHPSIVTVRMIRESAKIHGVRWRTLRKPILLALRRLKHKESQ